MSLEIIANIETIGNAPKIIYLINYNNHLMGSPVFEKEKIEKLHQDLFILKNRVIDEVNRLLEERNESLGPQRDDDKIFEPFIDVIALTMGQEMFFYMRDIGELISDEVIYYEATNRTQLNKSYLYSALSFLAIYNNDTLNTVIYWEISQNEEAILAGQPNNPNSSTSLIEHKFTSPSSPITESLEQNSIYGPLKSKYGFIKGYLDLLKALNGLDKLAYLSSGIRNKLISWWIKANFSITSPKIFGQELINSLCILNESILKDYPEVAAEIPRKKDQQIGEMIHRALPQISPTVAGILGSPKGGSSGLFASFPMSDNSPFTTNYPLVISKIETLALSDAELKAYVLLVVATLRNKALHDYDETLCYLSNPDLFLKTIGVLFAGVSVMKNLK